MKDYKDHNSLSNLINQNDQNHEKEDKIMNVHETKEDKFYSFVKFYLHSKSAIKKVHDNAHLHPCHLLSFDRICVPARLLGR